MAKISRVSLARKKELEKPDAILEFLQQASIWVSSHQRQAIIAVGAFLGIIALFIGITYFSARSEKIAFTRLTEINQKAETGSDQAEILEDYHLLNKKRGNTVAGEIAGLKYADACYAARDFENAITAYQQALSDFKHNNFLKILAVNGLGYAYEAVGDNDRAIEAFKQIIDTPHAPIKDKALFNAGRLYESLGDRDSSREMYSRITAEYPNSIYARIVIENGA